jgi:hypothetical protein
MASSRKNKNKTSRFHLEPISTSFTRRKNLQDAEFYREGEEER